MSTREPNRSALDIIDSVEFRKVYRGYDADEVDGFLEDVAKESAKLREDFNRARQSLRMATERIRELEANGPATPAPAAPAPTSHEDHSVQVRDMLAVAQEFVNNLKAEANEKVSSLIAEAHEKARNIVAEAQRRAEDEVQRLNGVKQRLNEDVETLTRRLEVERQRLGTALKDLAGWLDQNLAMRSERPAPSAPTPTASPAAPAPQAQTPAAPRPVTPPPAPAPTEAPRLDSFRDDNA